MKSKHHLILYTFLSFALIIAVFLAVDSGARADKATHTLEDSYAQRVLETQEHLQAIGVKLGKVSVAQEPDMRVELLSGVSRQADGVVTGLSALPLSHIAMSDTIKFCNQLSEYAMGLALSCAAGAELGEEDRQQLALMQSQCALLLGQLVTARDQMLQESLRLAGSENVYYAEAELAARPLEQVSDSDNGMDYPSMIYDGAFSDARRNGTPKALGQRRIDAAQAVELAKAFVGASRVASAEPSAETAGTLASYGVALKLNDGTQLTAEVTKQGGQLLWIVPEHADFATTLSVESCEEKALAFLSEHGYGDMEANHFQVYDGLAVINFVAVQDGVLLYPDLVKLQLRMDTGEVVGLESNNYLMNHTMRAALAPTLSKEQALQKVDAGLGATQARLCVIPYKDTEKLCYEVPATSDGQEYRVYIDAATGEELQILLMINTSDGSMSA